MILRAGGVSNSEACVKGREHQPGELRSDVLQVLRGRT